MKKIRLVDPIQKLVGKITRKHCTDCSYHTKNSRCRNITTRGAICRNGIYPIGYKSKAMK